MAQFAQRLRFDLADALARHSELLADFLEGPRLSIDQTEAQANDFLLATRESVQHGLELLLKEFEGSTLERDHGLGVLDEVAEVAVLLLAYRRFE